MIDFGMVGRLSPTRRYQIVDLLAGIARHDEQPMLEVLLDWAGDDAVDEERLAADLGELVTDYADVALKDLRVGALIARITQLVRDHGIVMPADLTLMFKALITLEGLGRKYDPEFRLTDRLRPFLDRALAARYAPLELGRRGSANLGQLLGLIGSVPRDVARLLKDARRGRIRVDLDLKRLDSFGRKLDETIDRITVGIMTASLVIGSSIVMTVTSGPQILGMPLFTVLGLLGYLLAFVNSVWIVVSIWRSERG
jgi:ubiquinone biosynthesis protein